MADLNGRHRPHVLVKPLQPPFDQEPVMMQFHGDEKALALSKEDAKAVMDLLHGRAKGKSIIIEQVPNDDEHLMVSIAR